MLKLRTILNINRRFSQNSSNAHKNPLFDKILIANRGEIACRVMKTAKKLGVKTVAVYSEIDKNSMHVDQADEAYFIGPAPSSESYLAMDRIIEVAKRSGAQAIHPGYGFLSENADFAQLVADNGLTFIGPPPKAIISMGSKRFRAQYPIGFNPSASKNIMQKANVPVVPGYHGENQDPQHLEKQAALIGYPVLIKAIKGGGGKGMRIVEKPQDFQMMLESSRRESKKSFGDDRVLVEKYLTTPRHVEVQVFCDKFGNAVYLFERDCSVQRRHQKVIEEAPAPNLSPEIRKELGEKAVAAAKAVDYVGAGTVEFIMDNDTKQFYFMEMNTRLQVEHPVTEMITKTDLVEWQLEVASGNVLPKFQKDLLINGHCFEARIYAENPRNNFLPDSGKLLHLRSPTPSEVCRVETGVRYGDNVSVYYDPMIAKLVVWGIDRSAALKKLSAALSEYQVVGLETNIQFLKSLALHPEFHLGNVETGFIAKYKEDLLPSFSHPPTSSTVLAAVGFLLQEQQIKQNAEASSCNDQYSPWIKEQNFRMNGSYKRTLELKVADNDNSAGSLVIEYVWNSKEGYHNFTVGSKDFKNVTSRIIEIADGHLTFEAFIKDQRFKATIVKDGNYLHLFEEAGANNSFCFGLPLTENEYNDEALLKGIDVTAPMPSKIAQVLVKKGQKVKQGDPVIILEAMKMEHVMRAGVDGVVEQIRYSAGDLVNEGQMLVTFEKNE